jgi:FkbM family methyltransferase
MSGEKGLPVRPMPGSMILAHRLGIILARYPVRGRGVVQRVVRKLLVPDPGGPTQIRTRFGVDLVVDPTRDHALEFELYYDGVYEAGTLSVMQKCLRTGDRVLDVGANIGLMSLVAARSVGAEGKVYAIEPEPETFDLLKMHIRLNAASNIIPLNIAIGSARGSASLHVRNGGSPGSATLVPAEDERERRWEVCVESIDGLCAARGIQALRLVKIDVEGWELEVLRGAAGVLSREDSPIVIIECSRLHAMQGGQVSDIFSLLVSMNDYRVYKLKRGKSAPSRLVPVRKERDIPYHDNLFCFLPAHIEGVPRGMFAKR